VGERGLNTYDKTPAIDDLENEIIAGAIAEIGRVYSVEEVDRLTAEGIDADEFLANSQVFLSQIWFKR
jgi:hypothetical protein